MRARHAVSAAVVGIALVACARKTTPPSTWLVVESDAKDDFDLARARIDAPGAPQLTLSGSKLVVGLDRNASGPVTVHVDGACPLTLSNSDVHRGGVVTRRLSPWFDFGGPFAALGFGAPLTVVARPSCGAARATPVTWKVEKGDGLRDVTISEQGRRFAAVMPRADATLGTGLPWGIVPISPRTRGEVELRATWIGDQGRAVSRAISASAAARSRGLANVALGTRVYFAGADFHLTSAPPGARTTVETTDGVSSLLPDARGTWTLSDERGRSLRLVAGKYDETPLDCGRSDCHASVVESAARSPMTSVFQRGLDAPFHGDYPSCAFGCHTVGEPGMDDGGFAAIAAELGRSARDLARTGYHDLPASLRREAGVGCLACHGPGRIPEPSGRYALLKADVCATCHDAPPRYGHVVAWRSSRMARSDADPRARDGETCARCHTTAGFLGRKDLAAPPEAGPVGIACAACHAVHPEDKARGTVVGGTCAEALRRDVAVPPLLGGALPETADKSRICLGCHSPSVADGAPAASAAAIWAGRGGLDPASGAALAGSASHLAVAGGCVGCHRGGPAGLALGQSHAFRASRDACSGCHAEKPREPLAERARALWAKLSLNTTTPMVDSGPAHARTASLDRTTSFGRAAWDVALVLEDPAADAHNAAYARALLDAAEHALAAAPSKEGARP